MEYSAFQITPCKKGEFSPDEGKWLGQASSDGHIMRTTGTAYDTETEALLAIGAKPTKGVNKMNTRPISSDQRWSVTEEWTGKKTPQFVIRFCETWVDSRSTYAAAVVRAVDAKAVRDGALVATECAPS